MYLRCISGIVASPVTLSRVLRALKDYGVGPEELSMRLVSITTKNFRTLQDLRLTFANSYCTISGKNNAGKSSVIRLLSILFGFRGMLPWSNRAFEFSYKEDKTQWVKNNDPIEIKYLLHLEKNDDPALISFIEKMASKTASNSVVPMEREGAACFGF